MGEYKHRKDVLRFNIPKRVIIRPIKVRLIPKRQHNDISSNMFIKGAGINLTLVSGQVGFFFFPSSILLFFLSPVSQFQDEERHKEFCLYLTSISSFVLARTLSVLQGSFL